MALFADVVGSSASSNSGSCFGGAAGFFGALAAHWKRHYPGWTAWLLSPEMKLPALMRLKESRRVPMWNGPIECRLFRFEMVAGSARGAPAGTGTGAGDDAG